MSCKTDIISTGGAVEIVPAAQPAIVVVSGGRQGARGPSGDGGLLARVAAQALGGHRVVRGLANGMVDYADSGTVAHADLILGVTTGAAANGATVAVRAAGEIIEGSWNWTPGPIFCGANGQLTQTPPSSGFIRQIGIADAPDRIVIDLRPPIVL